MNNDIAFQNFFRNIKKGATPGFPRFKKRDENQSYTTNSSIGYNTEKGTIRVPKIKEGVKAVFHREIPDDCKLKTITISKAPSGKYYASLMVEYEAPEIENKVIDKQTAIGVDLGIKSLLVLSDGTEIKNNKHLKKSLKKLKREQRSLSRKQKTSNNYKKQRIKLAKLHEKISFKRRDDVENISHKLVTTYDTICMEDLNVKGMQKNHKLAQSLSDASFGMLNEKINQKAKDRGVNVLRVDRFFASSKTCSNCGFKLEKMRLSTRNWTCPDCGVKHDRDINAAKNIKDKALKDAGTDVYAGTDKVKTKSKSVECGVQLQHEIVVIKPHGEAEKQQIQDSKTLVKCCNSDYNIRV